MAKNLLDVYQRNSTFDPSWGAGMRQLPEGNIFVPDGWDLGWRADAPFEGIHNEPPGLVARRPEATIINEWQGLEPELTPDASYAWKIFVQNPLYAMIALNSPIALPAGNYKLQVKVWPKLHMNGAPGNPHPSDPWAAEVGLQLADGGLIDWVHDINYAAYNVLEWRFAHAGGPFNFQLHFKGKYPIDNTFFFHWVRLEEIESTPEPGTGGNNGIVEFGPLTLGFLERLAIAAESIAAHFSAGEPEPPEPEPATLTIWSQRDPRWANQVYAGGATFGASGCLVCAYASIASQALHPAPTPPEFAHDLRDVGAFSGALLSNPARIPLAYPALEWGGAVHWRKVPADLALLQRELSTHGPVVCEVKWNPDGPSPEQGNQHFVIVERLLRDTAGSIIDAAIADPWDGERRLLSASRYRKPGWDVARTLYGARLLHPGTATIPATPANLRGVHGAPTYNPPADVSSWIARLQALGIRWYKLLDAGGNANDGFIRALVAAGITPVVRLYQGRQFPGRLAPQLQARLPQLAALGVTYVEIGNEPNLISEWSVGAPDYHDSTQVAQVAASWWQDAHAALEAGLSPALYALAPTERNYGTHPTASSIGWQHALLTALKRYGEAEMTALLSSGRVWLAVHTADFGRDFDYPWRTVAGVDDMCLLGYKIHRATVEEVFGVRPTIISTEGGVYSPEHLAALSFNPTYDEVQWGPRLRDMYTFLEQQGDMLAMCPWTFSDEGAPEEWHNCGWYRANGSARSPAAALRG